MLATVSASEALAIVRREHEFIEALLRKYTHESLCLPGAVRYGLFPGQGSSLKDAIGHLQLWENISLEALYAVDRGSVPWICEPQYDSDAAGMKLNLDDDALKREWPPIRVVQAWRATAAALEDSLSNISAVKWTALVSSADNGSEDLGGLLQSLLTAPREKPFEHIRNHLPEAFV
ncbi:MAG: hypothetical protein KME17_11215 [Cyanosarcina radialis HA8281-LM2]|jgi:hypothetical protein|nr:hypothetical protein [Cyanosarcina radialis HA8281-LM2]